MRSEILNMTLFTITFTFDQSDNAWHTHFILQWLYYSGIKVIQFSLLYKTIRPYLLCNREISACITIHEK